MFDVDPLNGANQTELGKLDDPADKAKFVLQVRALEKKSEWELSSHSL